MGVAAQHLPVLVASDGAYIRNIEALFEQAAGRFMPQVVEAKPA